MNGKEWERTEMNERGTNRKCQERVRHEMKGWKVKERRGEERKLKDETGVE